jgi:hypothetical protein
VSNIGRLTPPAQRPEEARMHGTPTWIEENGKIIAVKP